MKEATRFGIALAKDPQTRYRAWWALVVAGEPESASRSRPGPSAGSARTGRRADTRRCSWQGFSLQFSSDMLCRVAGMILSKLTSKAQTTVPQPVRKALRLREGDEIAYAIEQDRVVMTKARAPRPKILLRHSTNGTARPIARPMASFEQGDIVRVPFPYTDRSTRQHRPALVVSAAASARRKACCGW